VVATPDALDYARTEDLAFWAYNTLLAGSYARPDRSLQAPYLHADTERRLAALDRVATSTGATRNQVVLAWLMGGSPAVTPIVGVSSVAQLDEVMAARGLTLDADALAVLNSVS
jgi:aryl-alcohol dehydrogenase-like predicted oxidoreductase